VARPAVAWRHLVLYGVLMGLQFGLLFLAMRHDISPGLASLVIQSQVFITLVLAAQLRHEHLGTLQFSGLALASCGIAVIGWIGLQATDTTVTLWGLTMVLGAASCWAVANLVSGAIGRVDMLGFMVWSSLFAVPPLLLLCLVFEGTDSIAGAVQHAGPGAWMAVAWQAAGNTLFGFGVWGWLLARHAAATITPMALLVPVFGMGASALVLAEPLPAWKLGAAVLVLGGLGLNLLAGRWAATSRRAG